MAISGRQCVRGRAIHPGSSNLGQTTLARSVSLAGLGVHNGKDTGVTIAPASGDTGIIFIADGQEIEALWLNAQALQRQTSLITNGVAIATIEHLTATLMSLGVDNAMVHVTGGEVPAMDGSARCFVEAIDEVGLVYLKQQKKIFRVVKPVRVSDGAAWAQLTPAPFGLSFDVEVAFRKPIGRQRHILSLTSETFRKELAWARSFGSLDEAERLWSQGVALGASLENSLVYDEKGVLNPHGERYENECARHKMLDAIGDLALAGAPLVGAFRSYRSGHRLNVTLLKAAFDAGALVLEKARNSPACGQMTAISP
ncbi:MAG: UDP-3-O-acyl-N-acetylglucosamine deacetylase [Methylocystis sp.]